MFGIDVDSFDWRVRTPEKVMHNVFTGLDKKSGGILHALVVLLTEYVRTLGLPDAEGWRSRSRRRQVHLAVTTVAAAPLMLLSWLAIALDSIVDRNSRSPSGLVLIATTEPGRPSG